MSTATNTPAQRAGMQTAGGRDGDASKRVVMVVGEGVYSNIVYHALKNQLEISRVIVEQPVPRLAIVWRRARKLGFLKAIGQLAFQSLAIPILRAGAGARVRALREQLAFDDSPLPEQLVSRVSSVNARETIELLKSLNPAVVIVNGTRIISEKVLREVPATFVNTHLGITPLYRGVHGGYWALVDGNRENCGVTVHCVDKGIDTGKIIGQSAIEPTAADSFVTYPFLQIAAGIPLLADAVRQVLSGPLATLPNPAGPSKLFSHPTLAEYLWYRFTRGVK